MRACVVRGSRGAAREGGASRHAQAERAAAMVRTACYPSINLSIYYYCVCACVRVRRRNGSLCCARGRSARISTVEYPGVPEVGLQISRPQAPLRFKHSTAVGMTAWRRGAVGDSDPNASSRLGYFMPYGLYCTTLSPGRPLSHDDARLLQPACANSTQIRRRAGASEGRCRTCGSCAACAS